MSTPRALQLTLFLMLCCFGFGCGDSTPAVPDTPDGTVHAVTEGLAKHQPEVLWAALPASYQKDVNDLVSLFANKMDAELYDKGFGIAQKVVTLLRDKKTFILEYPMLNMIDGFDIDKADQNWDSVTAFAETIVGSEISSLNKLKSLDVNDFLAGTVAKLMNQAEALSRLHEEDPFNKELMNKLKGTKAEVVSVDGDVAQVKISAPGEKTMTRKMVKVEGKWIPEQMARSWKEGIAEAREHIAEIDKDKIAEEKQQYMAMLAQIEQALDQLAAANDKKTFNMAVGKMMKGMMGDLMGGGPGGGPGGMPGGIKIPK